MGGMIWRLGEASKIGGQKSHNASELLYSEKMFVR